jgi:hypothetical protein
MGMPEHVMIGPPAAEVRVPHGQVPDQLGELGVIGVTAGVVVQRGDGAARRHLPVAVQLTGARVEEHVPGHIALAVRPLVEVGDQRPAHPVGGQHVQAAADDAGRDTGQ